MCFYCIWKIIETMAITNSNFHDCMYIPFGVNFDFIIMFKSKYTCIFIFTGRSFFRVVGRVLFTFTCFFSYML